MTEQPIDTTKELKFYLSKIIIIGCVFSSFVFGLATTRYLLLPNNDSLYFVLEILLLTVFLTVFIWSAYKLLFDSLLIIINRQGIYIPKKGNISWGSIKGIYLSGVPSFYSLIPESPSFLKIDLLGGGSFNLKASLISTIAPEELLEILRTYHSAYNK